MRVALCVFAVAIGAAWADEAAVPPRFEQARALYAQGPSRATEVIDLLKQELKSNPEYEPAVKLLAITYFGTEQFQKALDQFDHALRMTEARHEMVPQLLFYKAVTLNELGRCPEAKRIVDVYWALWQDDETLKAQSEQLSAALNAACGGK